MSLLASAATWTNDDSVNKKRIPTIRKTVKMRPTGANDVADVQDSTPDSNEVFNRNYYQQIQPASINDVQAANQDKNTRVNELLNKITSANTGEDNSKLGNFKPPSPPALNVKKDMADTTDIKQYLPTLPTFASTNIISNRSGNYSADDTSSSNYSNYVKSYEPPAKLPQPYYATMGITKGGSSALHDDKLMEKINYMIYMLEEQQNEKTANITEEFILYTFLGVFIIFLVDSFARTGKYTR